ncbi:DoxX family protein [Paraburkholderia megapolitana]|uniref:DoxX-like family protein n=1 Tax=Paraburkholderia megapolitana TaxID=420953 RepID=A0A1I3Q6Y8_9BURK|nr:DoxX family protein [Paraburkholderia megapolitana]QDQ81131.1 DoxX family protein [Paraburkholderia megapolitana]SFJ29445.1 DoxX-like family protein [Paraburkholderia megapolitana]
MALSKTTNNRIVWAVRLLLALAFGAAGTAKLAGVPLMIQIFEHIGFGQWFRYVTGLVEVTGAVLLLIPRTGFLGGLLLAATMVCALATHLLIIGGNPGPAALLALLSAFVAHSLRSPYGELARAGERT